jgi:hypothetical protein
LDWANERYVRLYTRNTAQWIALGWEAQNLAMQIFRVLDRAGVLDLGGFGPMGVAIALREVGRWESEIQPALERLVKADVVRIVGDRLVAPNFQAAQETPQSDRMRKAESRARRREVAMGGGHEPDPPVTKRDTPDPEVEHASPDPVRGMNGSKPGQVTNRTDEVTKRDHGETNRLGSVTSGHERSQMVTLTLTDPRLTDLDAVAIPPVCDPIFDPADKSSSSGSAPDGAAPLVLQLVGRKPTRKAREVDAAHADAAEWLEWFNRRFVGPTGSPRRFELRDEIVDAVRALRAKKFTQEDMRMVAVFKQAQWQNKPEMRHLLVPATLLRVKTFGGYLDAARLWFDAEDRKHG